LDHVKRTSGFVLSVLEHVGADLRCAEILVAEQLLHGADVRALLWKVGGQKGAAV
jgi:hypothetical protein